jgi:hypothetical protein
VESGALKIPRPDTSHAGDEMRRPTIAYADKGLQVQFFSKRDFLFPDADEKYVPEVLTYIHSYDVKVKQIPTEIATQTARVKK